MSGMKPGKWIVFSFHYEILIKSKLNSLSLEELLNFIKRKEFIPPLILKINSYFTSKTLKDKKRGIYLLRSSSLAL